MEKGHLRCDANVSLRAVGTAAFGTKTEIKNLNSIRGVERAIVAEIARQNASLEAGERIQQATLLYDADTDRLAVMRSKEHAHDYRYFPEPDLPRLEVGAEWIASARESLPELPWVRAERWAREFALPAYDAGVLCEQRDLADYFESCARGGDAKQTSNWIMTEVLRVVRDRNWTVSDWDARVSPGRLREFLARVAARGIPGPLAKQVFGWMTDESGSVAELLERHGVRVQSSAGDLMPLVREVLAEHPGPVAQYRAGKAATLGFLVGQVMKKSGGQAVPQVVQELIRTELAGSGAP
ncbi:MAG: Asp-tRNA(Asn)/Glu-tRNA(Gln) amidotransferase subunit GatB, partial [Gaiellaceae bacterium]